MKTRWNFSLWLERVEKPIFQYVSKVKTKFSSGNISSVCARKIFTKVKFPHKINISLCIKHIANVSDISKKISSIFLFLFRIRNFISSLMPGPRIWIKRHKMSRSPGVPFNISNHWIYLQTVWSKTGHLCQVLSLKTKTFKS